MLDSNVFDRLDADPEAVSELANRPDIRAYVTAVQLDELSRIPDEAKRARLLALADGLCFVASAGVPPAVDGTPGAVAGDPPSDSGAPSGPAAEADRHEADRLIAAAAASRCDLLVSDDARLALYARERGLRAVAWDRFVAAHLFRPR